MLYACAGVSAQFSYCLVLLQVVRFAARSGIAVLAWHLQACAAVRGAQLGKVWTNATKDECQQRKGTKVVHAIEARG